MLKKFLVEELSKEIYQENKGITLMTVGKLGSGIQAHLYKNHGLHFKI
jgi:hypothetical protein